jgi:hypothetical protein
MEIAQLTTALSRLMNSEGRARGRRQRLRLRAEDAKTRQLPAVDLDGEFFLDEQNTQPLPGAGAGLELIAENSQSISPSMNGLR